MRTSLLLFTWLLSCSIPLAAAADRPNIVFVLFDDIGYGEPGCYNPDSPFHTPQLDKLASQGMRFTNAHAPAACCTPSRYGFLTGRYPSRIGTLIDQDRAVGQETDRENQAIMAEQAVADIHEQAKSEEPFFFCFPMCPPHKPHVPAPAREEPREREATTPTGSFKVTSCSARS